MAISSTTTFRQIQIYCKSSGHGIKHINVRPDDGERNVSIEFNSDGTASTRSLILEILQNLYASDDGIVDENGDASLIDVAAFAHGNTHADLIKYWWTPLDPDAYDLWLKQQEANNLVAQGEQKLVTLDEGGYKVESFVGLEPMQRSPDTSTYTVNLGDIVPRRVGDRIQFNIQIDESDEISENDLDSYAPIMAFVEWLKDNQPDSETDFGTDFSDGDSFSDRSVTFNQEADDDTSEITLNDALPSSSSIDGNVISWGLSMARESGGGLDVETIRELLENTDVTISSTGQTVAHQFGSVEVPVDAEELRLKDGIRIYGASGVPYVKMVNPETEVITHLPLIGEGGGNLDYEDLKVYEAGSSVKVPPETPYNNRIHFKQATNGTIRFKSPENYTLVESANAVFHFHNIAGNSKLVLQDWDGNKFAELRPAQYCEVTIAIDDEGDGELVARIDPRQMLHEEDSSLGDFDNALVLTTSSLKYRIIPVGSTAEIQDRDVFEVGTTTPDTDSEHTLSGYTDFSFKHGWKMLYPGEMDVHLFYRLNITSGGSIAADNGPTLHVKRDAYTFTLQFDEQEYPSLTAAADGQTYHLTTRVRMQENDIAFLAHKYPTASAPTWGNVEFINLRRDILFYPIIKIPYTPS